ncbi:MarR family winged helix-turn-helix transcriptional regulator [Flavobacterium wongokense]|uniref:MarR family winged helix-turn-helix transcriptional regulator n=1 Tax=Flavobacterium wongokense TaxID=2910674 RepID=UPI001F3FF1E0|nr:MarR family transcriptional regulator [Flavobacterium sp. WG47]MCF6130802.1 MarR family transcriptional regulator [Flavobacterium sp. WG47]
MEKLEKIIFYNMDKAIKSYRMFAQKKLKENGFKITIDQWLIIKTILENPTITQQEIARNVFKDNASVTRIIDLLVKSEYLERRDNPDDRRKSNLVVTEEGESIIYKVQDLVLQNRKNALNTITPEELETMNLALKKIIDNCS